MIQSMTGFGSAEINGFKVEIRSLNQRYMELSVKLPTFLMEHEIAVRNIIKKNFSRGKFDVFIVLTEKNKPKIKIDKELAKNMYEAFSELQQELSLPGSIGVDMFSGCRDILISEEQQYDTGSLYEAVSQAVFKLIEARKEEGDSIRKEMLCLVKKLEAAILQIEGFANGAASKYRENLLKKVSETAPNITIDETRLAQEIVLMAQKADISEEIARLKSHLRQFDSFLTEGGVIGRKLDFLLQEMNREANTIASKSDDIRIINLTISMKIDIEKLREQSQNIE